MKRVLCSLLVLSVVSAAMPLTASAAEPETVKAPAATEAVSIRAAILKAGPALSTDAARPATRAEAQKVPTSLPRSGSNRIRKQGGGGHAGMVIGLVSSLVGVAATVYMVNEMKKSSDADKQ